MKQRISLLVFLMLLSASLFAGGFTWGVDAGWDIRKIHLNSKALDVDNRTGWFIGPRAIMALPLTGLSLEGSVLYNQRKMAFQDIEDNAQIEKQLSYLVFPVNVRYKISLLKLIGAYISTGPQWSRYINGSKNLNFFDSLHLRVDGSTLSWNVGAGVDLANHLQVGFTYNFGIDDHFWTSDMQEKVNSFKANKNSCQIRVSCSF